MSRSHFNAFEGIKYRRRKGGSLMETILVMPILISLGFGVVDYGYCIYLTNTFQSAAQAGARAGIPNAAANSDVTNVISAQLTAAGISSSNYSVTLSPSSVSGLTAGTNITVTITTETNRSPAWPSCRRSHDHVGG